MEPEGSVPCSQEPSTGPYPEPYQSNPHYPIPSLWDLTKSVKRLMYVIGSFGSPGWTTGLAILLTVQMETSIINYVNIRRRPITMIEWELTLILLMTITLWRIRPIAGDVEGQKPRGTRLRNSSGVLPSRALLLLPPHRALLGYAVNTGSHNSKKGARDLRDVICNNTKRCVLPYVRL
jgi:hypothetical protein